MRYIQNSCLLLFFMVMHLCDKSQLVPSLQGIINNTDKRIKIVLADADYGTYDSLEYMAQHNMVGYVPYRDMNTTFEDQPFHVVHFLYDQELDC